MRRVQDLRKTAGYEIADRIALYYTASAGLSQAVAVFVDYIQGETLAVEMAATPAPEGAATVEDEFDGETLRVGIVKKV